MTDRSTAVPASSSSATAAYARVYEEQQPRLVAYARSLTRNAWTAEDLVAEAHFRVWRRLSAGHEIDNVPAYLRTTVRHLAMASGSATHETPRDPRTEERAEPGRHGEDPAERVAGVDLVVRVLGQLPERWVKALWLAEAEGQPLAAIGPQLGTKEGATAVLLHRAREGMRQAFLRAQTGVPEDPACQVHWARMPAYVRGAATARQQQRLLGHVDACDDCRGLLASLMQANDRLPALVGPALLVLALGGTGKFLLALAAGSAGAAGGLGTGVLHGVRHATVGGAKAPLAATAGALVAGAAAVCLVLGWSDSATAPVRRTPVAEAPTVQVPADGAPMAEGAEAQPSQAAVRAEAPEDVGPLAQAADNRETPPARTADTVTPTTPTTDTAPTATAGTDAPQPPPADSPTPAPGDATTEEPPRPVDAPPTDHGTPKAPAPAPVTPDPDPDPPQPGGDGAPDPGPAGPPDCWGDAPHTGHRSHSHRSPGTDPAAKGPGRKGH
ncbi:sigma-70 family RNA polymerase sigma factor [Streptomyces soliscabiei]|uniref:sigma-70 family RNA polymerase sigma factor n=1 Tax=Streptomyces soliscabiei TaxID=588897 RepID=UPI0029A1F348|nr:sigma-70 family RNA polymerase sigma factor [Streptomyces sp. NY05-11A]MDX2681575.1 sigma-70 family RNA polymerase sigma factor [Streptomyces sp. NY05-11A]